MSIIWLRYYPNRSTESMIPPNLSREYLIRRNQWAATRSANRADFPDANGQT